MNLGGIKEYNNFLLSAQIADRHYSVGGCNVLFPYGKALEEMLVNFLKNKIFSEGFLEVELPTICSNVHTDRLNHSGLYTINNENHTYGVSVSHETQLCELACKMMTSFRSLPIRLFSEQNVYRDNSRLFMIKMLEYRNYEFSLFSCNEKAAKDDFFRMYELISNALNEIGVYHIFIREEKGQYKFYTYFPQYDAFGSIVGGAYHGDQYTKIFLKHQLSDLNIVQYDIGFTSRIFSAYLSNHFDGERLRFPNFKSCLFCAIITSEALEKAPAYFEFMNNIFKKRPCYTVYNYLFGKKLWDFVETSGIPIFIYAKSDDICLYDTTTRQTTTINNWNYEYLYNFIVSIEKRLNSQYQELSVYLSNSISKGLFTEEEMISDCKLDILGYYKGKATYVKRRI